MAMVASNKPPASMLYPAPRRDRALSPIIECFTRHWLDPFAIAKSSLLLRAHDPSEMKLANKTADLTLYEGT